MVWAENNQPQRQHKLSAKLRKLKFTAIIALALLSTGVSAYAISSDEVYQQLAEKAAAGDSVAFNALENSADQGDAYAQYELGVIYRDGQGVAQDYDQAVSWYRKAADQGNADAQNSLGVMYANGQGVPKDYAQAASWYRKAADQGDAFAQSSLGIMYHDGQGVPKDYAQAASWYRKAADQGNNAAAGAQDLLGLMYEYGQGVAQDAVIAYALYNLSLSASNDQSQDNPSTLNRQIISEHMTESQIEEGQTLTRHMKSEGVLKALEQWELELHSD